MQKNTQSVVDSKKKQDRFYNYLICQTVICVLVVLFAVVIKIIGGDLYNYTKRLFDEKFNTSTNIEQVLNANQTQKIINTHATVYGVGGTSEEIKHLKEKTELKENEKEELIKSEINSMHIPVDGRITSEYSYRVHPISGEYKFHSGLDIGANSGEDIKSALDGKVVEVDNSASTGYGKYIIVSHSDGVSTLYAHCSEIVAKLGGKVKKGELIAKVGSTGYSTGPHLHFEVRVNDICLNPKWYVNFV